MTKTILIAAGGTGGHIYPAISLAREFKRRGLNAFFVIKKNDVCIKILEKEGLSYSQLNISGLPRTTSPKLFLFIFRLSISFFKSIKIIKAVKPAAIIGLGGYVSFPPGLAGKLMGIPLFIHEQNVLPGIANRILSKFADKIAVSFPDATRYFKQEKTFFTGNPIRQEVINISKQDAINKSGLKKDRFTIFVFGGSQGAHGINTVLIQSLELLKQYSNRIQFIHITGEKDFESTKAGYDKEKFSAVVVPYMHDIGTAYAASDIAFCRAGAMTITELIALNLPAIIIPFPKASENHQEFNARYLADRNAAIMIRESDLSPEKLSVLLIGFMERPEKLSEMKQAYKNIPFNNNSSEIFANKIELAISSPLAGED